MAGSGFSDYVPEEKFLGPPSPKNIATPLNSGEPLVQGKLDSHGNIFIIAKQSRLQKIQSLGRYPPK